MKVLKKDIHLGINKGVEKGLNQAKIQIATKLLQENMSIEFVQKMTGLSVKQIEELKKDLENKSIK